MGEPTIQSNLRDHAHYDGDTEPCEVCEAAADRLDAADRLAEAMESDLRRGFEQPAYVLDRLRAYREKQP